MEVISTVIFWFSDYCLQTVKRRKDEYSQRFQTLDRHHIIIAFIR